MRLARLVVAGATGTAPSSVTYNWGSLCSIFTHHLPWRMSCGRYVEDRREIDERLIDLSGRVAEGIQGRHDGKRRGRKISRMCHNVEGIPRGSLFLDGQPGQECTNGIVNRLL